MEGRGRGAALFTAWVELVCRLWMLRRYLAIDSFRSLQSIKGFFCFVFFPPPFLGRTLHPCVMAAPCKGKRSMLPNPVPLPAITSEL